MNAKPFPIPVKTQRVNYSCAKCPAFCCTYTDIEVSSRDIDRLARHFGLDYARAEARFTKWDSKKTKRLLRHKEDPHFVTSCALLDPETRRCTVYEARPAVCRKYPDSARCGYYDFLRFERGQQGDQAYIATTA